MYRTIQEVINMAFANYMKNIRLDGNESQVNMAKILDISVTALKLIENGSTKFPSEKVLKKICEYTNSDAIEVIMSILFNEEDIKERPVACNYLAYMYLQGWNITESPLNIPLTKNLSRTFDAKITKKRENKNVIIVASCDRFFERLSLEELLEDHNVNGYMGDVASLTLSIMEPFRGLHILFDNQDKKQVQFFNLFEENVFHQLNFSIELKLFNVTNNEVVVTKKVTK